MIFQLLLLLVTILQLPFLLIIILQLLLLLPIIVSFFYEQLKLEIVGSIVNEECISKRTRRSFILHSRESNFLDLRFFEIYLAKAMALSDEASLFKAITKNRWLKLQARKINDYLSCTLLFQEQTTI